MYSSGDIAFILFLSLTPALTNSPVPYPIPSANVAGKNPVDKAAGAYLRANAFKPKPAPTFAASLTYGFMLGATPPNVESDRP